MERRLTVILAADVVGYSRLMGEDEAATLEALKAHRKDLFEPERAEHGGRLVKLMGDGALMEFGSVVDAVLFAAKVQRAVGTGNAGVPEDRRIAYRIGINIGDVIVDGEDIYGDGVNVAARLEGLAEPGGICISANVFDQIKNKVDLEFEDLGEQRVKNIADPIWVYRVLLETAAAGTPAAARSRPGARWRWAVAAVALAALAGGAAFWASGLRGPAPPAELVSEAKPGPGLPDRPSIAVLPFDNMSDDPAQEYFSDGITEDLITDLSQISGLFVIARNSVFTYKGTSVKVQQVGRELGVRYVLEGSVRKAGDRVRINAQLIDAKTGHHLWADRYDGALTDVFGLQDQVTRQIVAALAVRLTAGEQDLRNQAVEADSEAYDILLRGLERLRRFGRETNAEARELFEKAVALDPSYARAHADVALTYAFDAAFGWTDTPDATVQQALDHAAKALTLDPSNRHAYFTLGTTYLYQKRHEDAIAAARKSVALYPNYADGYAQLAQDLSYAGRPEDSMVAIEKALRLDPRGPFFYRWIVGHNHFLMGRYQAAVAEFEIVRERNPGFLYAHLTLASAYAHLGRIEDAEWEAQEVLTLLPEFSLERERQTVQYKNPADLKRHLDGLRQAGLPE